MRSSVKPHTKHDGEAMATRCWGRRALAGLVQWVTYLPLGVATLIDTIIALSLSPLVCCNSIDSTITVLMLYTQNTGVITSLCSLTAIIAMTTLPTTFAAISVEFMLTKRASAFPPKTIPTLILPTVYINSFLAM
ncbi:uncharacterized protein B0H18DRAFT_1051570 [Fomitopsis serialis]|uniref:uncharacterized protein n=1 Tax=Fomitopsis serialis TaxID=139415 RepID=UPI002008306C|nr:uncharacterized protein B0H18DRAFT_1051570 [Neoantrodia serialis]KAH9912825.1 hypothetical protein B0H18DRAFT_1051570 [Neoantrodia serialis]